jgi:hypothetical protein
MCGEVVRRAERVWSQCPTSLNFKGNVMEQTLSSNSTLFFFRPSPMAPIPFDRFGPLYPTGPNTSSLPTGGA